MRLKVSASMYHQGGLSRFPSGAPGPGLKAINQEQPILIVGPSTLVWMKTNQISKKF